MGEGDVPFHRYLNKRFTGWVNLKFRRHAVHKPDVAMRLLQAVEDAHIDHIVVTGDFTNTSLEHEFDASKAFIDAFNRSHDKISVIPGNHDLYTEGSARKKRFFNYFSSNVKSDIESSVTDHPAGPFPYVQLRGPVALIGLATALPRLPMIASGEVGKAQLDALEKILALPEVRSRVPIILQHHPPYNPEKKLRTITNGLYDASALQDVLHTAPRAIVLHGHLHVRVTRELTRQNSTVTSIGATSSSLVDDHHDKGAGFNVYEINDDLQLLPPTVHTLDFTTGETSEREIHRAPTHLRAGEVVVGRVEGSCRSFELRHCSRVQRCVSTCSIEVPRSTTTRVPD